MTETTNLPEYLNHADARVSALLRLAQWTVDRDGDAEHYNAPGIATQVVPAVDPGQAASMFSVVCEELETATYFDTEGANAVLDTYGRWDSIVGQTADEKATELAAEHRDAARWNVEMLVTLHDNHGRRAPEDPPAAPPLRILKQGIAQRNGRT